MSVASAIGGGVASAIGGGVGHLTRGVVNTVGEVSNTARVLGEGALGGAGHLASTLGEGALHIVGGGGNQNKNYGSRRLNNASKKGKRDEQRNEPCEGLRKIANQARKNYDKADKRSFTIETQALLNSRSHAYNKLRKCEESAVKDVRFKGLSKNARSKLLNSKSKKTNKPPKLQKRKVYRGKRGGLYVLKYKTDTINGRRMAYKSYLK